MRTRWKGRRRAPAKARRKSPLFLRDRVMQIRSLAARTWWAVRGVAIGLGVVACLYAAWLGADWIIRHPSLSVREISVSGCGSLTSEAVVAASGLVLGEPLLYVDLGRARRMVLEHPWVGEAVVSRRLPDTVSITVKERRPVAVIPGSKYSIVDREGVILWVSPSYPGKFPLVTGAGGGGEPGRRVEAARSPLEVLETITASGILGPDRVSELSASGDSRILVSLVGSGTVLVMTRQGAQEEVRRLGALMKANRFDMQAAGYDLRFEGRVVRLPDRESLETGLEPAAGGRDRHGQG